MSRWYFLLYVVLGISDILMRIRIPGPVPLIQLRIRLLSSVTLRKERKKISFCIFFVLELSRRHFMRKGKDPDPEPDPGAHLWLRIRKAQKHADPADPDSAPDPQHWFNSIFRQKYCLLCRRISAVRKNLFREGNTLEEAHGFFFRFLFCSFVSLHIGRLHREKKDWGRGM